MRRLALVAAPVAVLAWFLGACSRDEPGPKPPSETPGPALRTILLAGTPRDRGRTHGTGLKAEIGVWLDRVRPADDATAHFAIETCGARIWPRIPPTFQEEIEGVAEGADRTRHEILFLTTRFELHEFGMGGRVGRTGIVGARVEADPDNTVAKLWIAPTRRGGAGKEAEKSRRTAISAQDLIVFVHTGKGGKEQRVVALPGMVGAFLVHGGRVAVTARPRPSESAVVLTGVPWPFVVRMLADGAELPAVNISCSYSVARDGKAGVWAATTSRSRVEFVEAQGPEPALRTGLLIRVDEFAVTTMRHE